MLNWEAAADVNAVYPRWRYYAVNGSRKYRLMLQADGWWHVLATGDKAYIDSLNVPTLDAAKCTAAEWEDAALSV